MGNALAATRGSMPDYDPATLLGAWHEVDPRPTLIMLFDRTVLWANSAAHRFIREFDGLSFARGALIVHDHRQHQALGEQLTAATDHPHCWTLRGEARERSATLSFQRLDDDGQVCGVRILEHRAPVYARFRQVYGLTNTEDRVLHQLLSGRVASEIALADGGSLETVRAHIKAIYAKVGVCSRESLFHAIGRFRIA